MKTKRIEVDDFSVHAGSKLLGEICVQLYNSHSLGYFNDNSVVVCVRVRSKIYSWALSFVSAAAADFFPLFIYSLWNDRFHIWN